MWSDYGLSPRLQLRILFAKRNMCNFFIFELDTYIRRIFNGESNAHISFVQNATETEL